MYEIDHRNANRFGFGDYAPSLTQQSVSGVANWSEDV
jgi:hypothetical protein